MKGFIQRTRKPLVSASGQKMSIPMAFGAGFRPALKINGVVDFHRRGFTLVEILVVIAIVSIISAGAVFSLARFRSESSLSAGADFVKTYLDRSRVSALAKEDGAGYGVKINSNNLVWFPGQVFNPDDPANETIGLAGDVEIASVSLENEGSAVFFNNLTGTTSPGSITLAVSSDPAQTATIYVNRNGAVYLAESVEAAKPTLDNRHLHFNLGWSISEAEELELIFLTEPNTEEAVAMEPYFDAEKTVWDYTGVFTVGGEEQNIRIHTHTLDAGSTLLSITRDMLENSTAVAVAIDSKTIVTYNADGSAEVGAFGGEMTRQ